MNSKKVVFFLDLFDLCICNCSYIYLCFVVYLYLNDNFNYGKKNWILII